MEIKKIIILIIMIICGSSLVFSTIDSGWTLINLANSNSNTGILMDSVPPLTSCAGGSSGDSSVDYSDRASFTQVEGDGTSTYMCGTGFDITNTDFSNNKRLVIGHIRDTGRALAETFNVDNESITFFLLSDGSGNESYRGINLGGQDNSFQLDSMEFGAFVWQPNYTDSLTTRYSGESNFDITNVTRFEFGFIHEQTGRAQNLFYSNIGYLDPYVIYGGTIGTPTDWEDLFTYTRQTDVIRVLIGVPTISLSVETPVTIGKSGNPTNFNDLGISIDYRPNVQDSNTDLNRKVHVQDGYEWIDTNLQSGDNVTLSGTYLDSSGVYDLDLNSSVGANILISGTLKNWGNIYFGSDVALSGIIEQSTHNHLDGANLTGATLNNNGINLISNQSIITDLIVKNNDIGLEIVGPGDYELGTLTFSNNVVDINITCTKSGTVTIYTQGQSGLNIVDSTSGSCNYVLDDRVDLVLNLNPANGSLTWKNLDTSEYGTYYPSEILIPTYPFLVGDSITIKVPQGQTLRFAYSYAGYEMQVIDVEATELINTKEIILVEDTNVDSTLLSTIRPYILNSTVNGTNPVKVYVPEMNLNKGLSKALVSIGQDVNNSLVGAIEQGLNNFDIQENQIKLHNDCVQFYRRSDLNTSQHVMVGIHFNLTNYSIILNPQDSNNMRVEFPNVPLDAGNLNPENLGTLENGISTANINILEINSTTQNTNSIVQTINTLLNNVYNIVFNINTTNNENQLYLDYINQTTINTNNTVSEIKDITIPNLISELSAYIFGLY